MSIEKDIERLKQGVDLKSYQEDLLTDILKHSSKNKGVSLPISLKEILNTVSFDVGIKVMTKSFFVENLKDIINKRYFSDPEYLDTYLLKHLTKDEKIHENPYFLRMAPYVPQTFNKIIKEKWSTHERLVLMFNIMGYSGKHAPFFWFFNEFFTKENTPILQNFSKGEPLELVQSFLNLGFRVDPTPKTDQTRTSRKILTIINQYPEISQWLIENKLVEPFEVNEGNFLSSITNMKNISFPWVETFSHCLNLSNFEQAGKLWDIQFPISEEKFKTWQEKEKELTGVYSTHFNTNISTPMYNIQEVIFFETLKEHLKNRDRNPQKRNEYLNKDLEFLKFWQNKINLHETIKKSLKQKNSVWGDLINQETSFMLNIWSEIKDLQNMNKVIKKINYKNYSKEDIHTLLDGRCSDIHLPKTLANDEKIKEKYNSHCTTAITDHFATLLHSFLVKEDKEKTDKLNFFNSLNLQPQYEKKYTFNLGQFTLEEMLAGSQVTWKHYKDVNSKVKISDNQILAAAFYGHTEAIKSIIHKINPYQKNSYHVDLILALIMNPNDTNKIKLKKHKILAEIFKSYPLDATIKRPYLYTIIRRDNDNKKSIKGCLENLNYQEIFYTTSIGLLTPKKNGYSTKDVEDLKIVFENIQKINADLKSPIHQVTRIGISNIIYHYKSSGYCDFSSALNKMGSDNLIDHLGINWNNISPIDKGKILFDLLKIFFDDKTTRRVFSFENELNFLKDQTVIFEEIEEVEKLLGQMHKITNLEANQYLKTILETTILKHNNQQKQGLSKTKLL